jgi:hypothetical protein
VYILRNVSRGASILSWALRNALRRTLLQPFHMINLLKFRAPGGQQTYDLYRDAAAGVVMREGGGLAYMGAAVVRPRWRITCMCDGHASCEHLQKGVWTAKCKCSGQRLDLWASKAAEQ